MSAAPSSFCSADSASVTVGKDDPRKAVTIMRADINSLGVSYRLVRWLSLIIGRGRLTFRRSAPAAPISQNYYALHQYSTESSSNIAWVCVLLLTRRENALVDRHNEERRLGADLALLHFHSGSIQLWCLFSLGIISGPLYDRVRISASLFNHPRSVTDRSARRRICRATFARS